MIDFERCVERSGWTETSEQDALSAAHEYRSYPAVHHAYVLSHDFFTTLSEAQSLVEEEFGLQAVDMSRHDVLVERPSLVQDSHAAYKLYARLVKPEDMRTAIDIVAGTVPSIGGGLPTSRTSTGTSSLNLPEVSQSVTITSYDNKRRES